MKTTRKILALALAVALIAVFTIPVFAYGYTYYHTYNGSEVETNGRCGGSSYSASTNTMDGSFLVKTNVKIYYYDYDGSASESVVRTQYAYGQEDRYTSRVSGAGELQNHSIVTYHYAGGHEIFSQQVFPSE